MDAEPASAPIQTAMPSFGTSSAARRSPQALRAEERIQVRTILKSERVVDGTLREVDATVLDAGRYRCSWSTM